MSSDIAPAPGSLEDELPIVCRCNHVKQHTYVIRDIYDAFVVMDLSLRGWFDAGYCPAYFPRFLGYEPLPTIEELQPSSSSS